MPVGVGAIAAVLGLDDSAIAAACSEAAQGEVVEPVNFNSPGQVVIAGHANAVQSCAAGLQGAGRKARRAAADERAGAQLVDAAGRASGSRRNWLPVPLREPQIAFWSPVDAAAHAIRPTSGAAAAGSWPARCAGRT